MSLPPGRFRSARALREAVLRNTAVVLFAMVWIGLAAASPRFRDPAILLQVLVQTSSLAILATGMTFVMLTAGIDLSVGAVMFLGAAVFGKLVLGVEGLPLAVAALAMLAIGATWGAAIGILVTRFRIAPFVVTLAALFVARGAALAITETRAMNLPDSLRALATGSFIGVPWPLVIALGLGVLAQITLSSTPFGRFLFAIGENRDHASKAGVPVARCVFLTYVLCGLAASISGLISLAELGAVSPNFGEGEEFHAISAAVLGGTSLFGGRGSVLPGAIAGALLIQTIRTGLNVLDVDPYAYPIVTSLTIFLAVWIDSARERRSSSPRALTSRSRRPASSNREGGPRRPPPA